MKTNYIKFRISDKLKAEIQEIAKNNEMTTSELMLQLVREEIKNNKIPKYTYASLDFIDEKTKEELFNEAKKYSEDEFELFKSEYGWNDWMYDFTTIDEDEHDIPFSESRTIERVLELVWNETMKRRKEKYWDVISNYMNDNISEEVHSELSPCSNKDFFERYMELDPDFQELLDTELSSYNLNFILN